MPTILEYDREAAVAYAHRWSFGRNPAYYNFNLIGGDCTNFASQVVYSGSKVMNFSQPLGWYYRNVNDRSPSWTSVGFFYNFMTKNTGAGPFAVETDVESILPGDCVQLSFDGVTFHHTPVVVSVGTPASVDNILVAAHTYDADNRPLNSYMYQKLRFLHILGVRK